MSLLYATPLYYNSLLQRPAKSLNSFIALFKKPKGWKVRFWRSKILENVDLL